MEPITLEAKHILNGKCIDSRAFHVLEDILELLVDCHLGLKTFEVDEDVEDPDEKAKLLDKAKKAFLKDMRNEIAMMLPKVIWPKELQDLFQGEHYGLLANPFNTRMVKIAQCEYQILNNSMDFSLGKKCVHGFFL